MAGLVGCPRTLPEGGHEDTFARCSDGIDNDGDGLIDCEDPHCHRHWRCGLGDAGADAAVRPDAGPPLDGSVPGTFDGGVDAGPLPEEDGPCDDGLDNDGDGFADCADLECTGAGACAACSPEEADCLGQPIWEADHETGNLSQWTSPGSGRAGEAGGAALTHGDADLSISAEMAHEGQHSAQLELRTPPEGGANLVRWYEPRNHREAYYSVWIYLPAEEYGLIAESGQYWNLFQLKSASSEGARSGWSFYLEPRPDGLYIKAGWGWGGGDLLPGPFAGDGPEGKWYEQSVAAVPLGQWAHLEVYLRQSRDFDGRLMVWLDGTELFDFDDIRSCFDNEAHNQWGCAVDWHLSHSSDGLSPSPASLYIDDATISTGRSRP